MKKYLCKLFLFAAANLIAYSTMATSAANIQIVSEGTKYLAGSSAAKDSNMPLNITSNHAEFDDHHGTATYTGNVISDQGSRHLQADKVIIQRNQENQIELVTAFGNPATFNSQPNLDKPIGFGKANLIKYYPLEDKAILIGDAELTQHGDIVQGPLLTYYFSTGLLQSQPHTDGRTTVILQPKNQNP